VTADVLARRLVDRLGGRYSTALGVDVDGGPSHVERWFLAASLFGAPIPASTAQHTFRVLERAGVVRIRQVRHVPRHQLTALLDECGYARYDPRIGARLRRLSDALHDRYAGQVARISERAGTYTDLGPALDRLPGWGPTTIGLFLRELRGVWPGADPPLGAQAAWAASHLGLLDATGAGPRLDALRRLAVKAGLDVRDLETALVRLDLNHRLLRTGCAGRGDCVALPAAPPHHRRPGLLLPGRARRH
jgi:hypothetical protein